jgi:hypothetical protein
VEGCCEHGDEHMGYIKGRKFSGQLSDYKSHKVCALCSSYAVSHLARIKMFYGATLLEGPISVTVLCHCTQDVGS